jgi:adenylate cyclase
MERRLAAILAADVAGYSRLMGEDEAGTLAALQTHRSELVGPAIARHHGRIVKLMGDGMLAEFGSVVEAVDCAAEVQRENSGLEVRRIPGPEPPFPRIRARFGSVLRRDQAVPRQVML